MESEPYAVTLRGSYLIQDVALNVVSPITVGAAMYIFVGALPQVISHYMADALWAYSLLSLILIIWQRVSHPIWIVTTFVMAAGFEVAQFLHVIDGTGDAADIAVYFFSYTIVLLLNKYFKSKYYANQFL